MWNLFDFNSDGKVSIGEAAIGIELIEGTFYKDRSLYDDMVFNDDELSDEFYDDEDEV